MEDGAIVVAKSLPGEGFVYLTPYLFGRTYNSTFYSNLFWDVSKKFRIAVEATYRETEYKEPTNMPNEGFGFHTQFAWFF